MKYFEENNITTDFISEGIEDSFLVIYPVDSVFEVNVPYFKSEASNIFQVHKDKEFTRFQFEFYELYMLFTEPIHNREYPAYYYRLPWFIKEILIDFGWFSPLCNGVSLLGNQYFKDKIPHVESVNLFHVNSLNHVMSEINFKIQEIDYKMVFDFQNGFYGPIDKNTQAPIPIDSLKIWMKEGNYKSMELFFLPEEEIKKKRNLTPRNFALNIFPDANARFYKTFPFSKYFAFRLTYPPNYYVWFYKRNVNKDLLLMEICEKLVDI